MSAVAPFQFKTQEDAIRYTARMAWREAPVFTEAEMHGAAHGLIAGLMGDADHAHEDWERWVACAKAEYVRCAQADDRSATAVDGVPE